MPEGSTILLVDDEDAVLKLLTYPLEREGLHGPKQRFKGEESDGRGHLPKR